MTLSIAATLIFSGCARKDTDGCRVLVNGVCSDPGQEVVLNDSALSCAATPSVNPAKVNEPLTVSVQAIGGTPPYLVGATSFNSSVNISKTYSQTGVVSENITVIDSKNRAAFCPLSLNVTDSGASALSCDLTAGVNEAILNQPYQLMASASGGQAPYTITITTGQSGASPIIKSSADGNASATAYYSSTGVKTATLKVVSQDGLSCTDSLPVSVYQNALALVAMPATSVAQDQTITLEARGVGLINPIYSFQTAEPGIEMTQNGNLATIRATDGQYHKFYVFVTANHTGGTVSDSAQLEFKGTGILGCQIAMNSSEVYPNQDALLTISGPQGEPIEIANIDAGGGIILSGTQNPVRLRYTLPGDKIVKIKARDAVTKGDCNNGLDLVAIVKVKQPLACTAVMSPNPAGTGQDILLNAILNGSYANASIIKIETPYVTSGIQIVDNSQPLQKKIRFINAGSYLVRTTVRDNNDPLGRTATCDTYQQVYAGAPFCQASFHNFDDLSGNYPISSARPQDSLKLLVKANISSGSISVNPGAPTIKSPAPANYVPFPIFANNIVYKNSGIAVATANIKNLVTGQTGSCQSTINLSNPLACSISGPAVLSVYQKSKRGSNYSEEDFTSAANFTVSLMNSKLPAEITFNNGMQSDIKDTVTENKKNYTAHYAGFGTYKVTAMATDYNDRVGSSCELNMTVNKIHEYLLSRASGFPTFGKSCFLRITNTGQDALSLTVRGGKLNGSQSTQSLVSHPGTTLSSQNFGVSYFDYECYMRLEIKGDKKAAPGTLKVEACLADECYFFNENY